MSDVRTHCSGTRGEVVILLAIVVVVLGLGAVGCRRAKQTEQETDSKDKLRDMGQADRKDQNQGGFNDPVARDASINNLKQLGTGSMNVPRPITTACRQH